MEWTNYLNDIKENFEIFFAEELLEAVDSLDAGQFGEILTKECKKHLIILKNG